MMKTLETLLEITVYSGILYGSIMLVKRVFKDKMSPFLHFALWGLLLARLMLPVTFESSVRLIVLPAAETEAMNALFEQEKSAVLLSDAEGAANAENTAGTGTENTREAFAAPAQAGLAGAAGDAHKKTLSMGEILLILWLAGVGVGFAYLAALAVFLRKRVKALATPPPERLCALFEEVRVECNLGKNVRFIGQRGEGAPASIFPGAVLAPLNTLAELDDEQARFILRHELTHIKRGDHLFVLLLCALNAIYWFNPFAWLAVGQMRADMETACDCEVVRRLDGRGKQAYAALVLSLFARESYARPALGMAEGGTRKTAEKRIRGVFMRRTSGASAKLAAALLSALLLLTCFTTACQPTPEREFVINRQEDYVETVIASQTFIPLSAPAYVEDAFKNPATGLTVRFEAQVSVPEAETYAILEVREHTFSDEEYLQLMEHFAPLAQWTQEVTPTREEWLVRIAKYRQNGRPEEMLEYMIEQMNAAPETFETVAFSLLDAVHGVQFCANRANGDGTYALLVGERGGGQLYYKSDSEAFYLSESWLEPGDDQVADFEGAFPSSTESALEEARAVLAILGLGEASLLKTEKSCVYQYDALEAKGHAFTFAHDNCGLPGINGMEGASGGGDDRPLPVLTAPWHQEIIMIGVYENGMMYVDVRNPVRYERELARNVVLLGFDEIMFRVREHMMATWFHVPERIDDAAVVITNMELCTALVVAKDDPDAGRLIPAWRCSFAVGGTTRPVTVDGVLRPAESYMSRRDARYFSALDGAYIEPRVPGDYLG